MDSLYEHVPKENLPKEYGGFEGNVETLFGKNLKEKKIKIK